MTARYNEDGIQFVYPETWAVVKEEPMGDELRTVAVHSPDGAFWSTTQGNVPVEQLVSQVAEAIAKEYEDVEVSPVDRRVGEFELKGIELHFYCLDFLVIAQVVCCVGDERSRVMLMQAESREFDQMLPVFDAITLSLFLTPEA